jgi:hypothetical protein
VAYPVDTVVTEPGGSDTFIEVLLPAHQEGDVVLVLVSQDGAASGTVYTSPAAPWVLVSSRYSYYTRQLIFYAIAGTDPLPTPVVTSSINDGFNAVATTVRDADTANPVDAFSVITRLGVPFTSPAITTTTDDCLLIGCTTLDNGFIVRFLPQDLNMLEMTKDGAVCSTMGYRIQKTAGVVPTFNGTKNDEAVYGVHFAIVAIRNKPGGKLPPYFKRGPTMLAQLGTAGQVSYVGLPTALPGAVIDGLNVYTATIANSQSLGSDWDTFVRIQGGTTANQPGWYGAVATVPECNLQTGMLSFRFFYEDSYTSYISAKGWMVVLKDALGNWAAYRITEKRYVSPTNAYTFFFKFPDITPLATSTTPPDLTKIVGVGFGYARINTSATVSKTTTVTQLLYWSGDETVAGGNSDLPASPFYAAQLLNAARLYDVVPAQGRGQALLRSPMQFGDVDEASFVRFGYGSSTEARAIRNDQKAGEAHGRVTLAANAASTVSLDLAAVGSSTSNPLIIAPASAPSADYSFDGATIFGVRVTLLSGMEASGARFYRCPTVQPEGATLRGCGFTQATELVALETSNPGNVIDCSFTQGDLGGHAIEITQPGTFAFVGNTFEGYGLDGTTDASIYNNSGGHVVLNVSGGGDTPTVRNGAGATTEVVSGAQVTVVGLATGSQVKVTKVSNGDVLFNGAESGGQISFSTTYIGAVRVDARKASASPFYKPWATQATTISGQTVEVTALQELDE